MDAQIDDPNLARQRLRLWLHTLKTVRFVESDIRDRLRDRYDTTLPRFDVLAALFSSPEGRRMTELSQMLMVSNGNVTGIVDRLTKDGLVERQPHARDRRAQVVSITDKGRALMEEMTAAHQGWINELFGSVTEADAARVISVMLDIRSR